MEKAIKKVLDEKGKPKNIARIAKDARHKLPGKSSLSVSFVPSVPSVLPPQSIRLDNHGSISLAWSYL